MIVEIKKRIDFVPIDLHIKIENKAELNALYVLFNSVSKPDVNKAIISSPCTIPSNEQDIMKVSNAMFSEIFKQY